jgi:hypothetical protein
MNFECYRSEWAVSRSWLVDSGRRTRGDEQRGENRDRGISLVPDDVCSFPAVEPCLPNGQHGWRARAITCFVEARDPRDNLNKSRAGMSVPSNVTAGLDGESCNNDIGGIFRMKIRLPATCLPLDLKTFRDGRAADECAYGSGAERVTRSES